MVGKQSLPDRSICRPCETPVDDTQHLRGSLAPMFRHAIVWRHRAAADRSPKASDRVESVRCILIQDHHGNETVAASGRQKGHIDAVSVNVKPGVLAVVLDNRTRPQNVVSGNRGAQGCGLRFEQHSAGVGDRGPEHRLVEGSECWVRRERITPIALRNGALARLSGVRFEQVHSKKRGIGDFGAKIPKPNLKYQVDLCSRTQRLIANRFPGASSTLPFPRSTRVLHGIRFQVEFSLGSAKAGKRDADCASPLRSVVVCAEKMPISVLSHPPGAGEMCGMNFRCTVRVGCGVKAEENFDDFLPGRTVRVGVEQPQVQLQMRLIVGGERRADRRFIQIFFFGHGKPHGSFVSNSEGFVNREDNPRHAGAG